jgi:hypothetical protein
MIPMAYQFTWTSNRLIYGKRPTNFSVGRDHHWPKMWRIKSPEGSLSDMVNLTRAKDAACILAGQRLRTRSQDNRHAA